MSRRASKQQELKRLRDVLLSFVQFDHTHFLDPLADSIAEAIEREYAAGRLGGLRELLCDYLEKASHFSGGELRQLDAILTERSGIRLSNLMHKRAKKLTAIRERGRITTDAQFRLVLARVDEIYAGPEHADEADELNEMLAAYETGGPQK